MCSRWCNISLVILSDSNASRKSSSVQASGTIVADLPGGELSGGPAGEDQRLAFPPLLYGFRLYDIVLYSQTERTKGNGRLSLQLETQGGQPVEASPQQPVDEHDDSGHDQRRSKQHVKAAGIAGAADGASQSWGRNNFPLEMKIFCDDAGVPGAARRRHHARDEIRENARQDEVPPAGPGPEPVDLRGFLKIRGNGHGAGDHIEKDGPLRTEKHQQHGGNVEAAPEK